MRYYHYIILVFLPFVLYRLFYLYKNKEGYESLANCLNQGYPDEFCKRTPLQACIENCPLGTFVVKEFIKTFPSSSAGIINDN